MPAYCPAGCAVFSAADSVTVTVTVTTNTPSAASLFYVVTPCRIIDTRNANGPQGGPALVSGGTRNITVAGVCGIPTGVVAVSVNVAVVTPSGGGYLTVFTGPANAPLPLASTIRPTEPWRTMPSSGSAPTPSMSTTAVRPSTSSST